MALSTHVENKYGHKQTSNTHKNTQIFSQFRPRQKPFNLLLRNLVRELFKFIYISISGKIYLQTKQNSEIQLISSSQNSLKTMPTLPRFMCPLEVENMYCTDMNCTVWISILLYGFFFIFFQKNLLNSVQLTSLNDVHTVPFVVFYALIFMPSFSQKSLLQLATTNFAFETFLQLSASFLQSTHEE